MIELDNLRNIQLKCVIILEEIDKVCRQHGIEYSLTGGSVIGYHLYEGFIPWDDDIDIAMTRDNYDKFLQVADTCLPANYSVENFENGKDRRVFFTKVVNKDTTVVELKQDNREYVTGVFVDITVLDRLPLRGIGRAVYCILSKVVQCCRDRSFETKTRRTYVKNIGIAVMKPFSNRFYYFCKRIFTKDIKEYGLAELFAGMHHTYAPKMFEQYIDVEFEGKKVRMVKNYMDYLEVRYGKRTFYKDPQKGDAPHHLVYADVNMPYEEFLRTDRNRKQP